MSNTTSPRLVALDLDGTLLNHQGQVTPRTRQAIAEAVARGIVVLPATGRPLSNLPPVVAQLTGVRYAITSNGAAVWDLGTDPMRAVYSRYCNAAEHRTTEPVSLIARPMPVELAREAFALYMEYPGAMSVFCDGRTYRDTVAMERFARRNARRGSTEARQPNDGRFTVVRDLTEWMSRHAHEVEKFCMFFDTAEQAQAALPRFRALAGAEVVQGSPDNIELTAQGVDKGAGRPAAHPPRSHRGRGRQRERPRHAGKGWHCRCDGQRDAPHPGSGRPCEHERLRPRRRGRAV